MEVRRESVLFTKELDNDVPDDATDEEIFWLLGIERKETKFFINDVFYREPFKPGFMNVSPNFLEKDQINLAKFYERHGVVFNNRDFFASCRSTKPLPDTTKYIIDNVKLEDADGMHITLYCLNASDCSCQFESVEVIKYLTENGYGDYSVDTAIDLSLYRPEMVEHLKFIIKHFTSQ